MKSVRFKKPIFLCFQGVANEALWVTLWYGRVLKALKLHTSVYGERPEVLITDRSPLSAKMYVKGPSNWVAPLTESIQVCGGCLSGDLKTQN